MTRGRLLALVCVAAAVAVSVAELGLPHTLIIVAVLAGVAVAALGGTEVVIRRRQSAQVAPIAAQLAIVIGLVGAPLVVAMLILGLAMFVSGADAALVGVIVVLSGVIGVAAAGRLSHGLSSDVDAMREVLAREETARRQLVAHASHDLRTPVTSLRLLATAVDDEVVDEGMRREYVGRMLTHIEVLSALIDDLFELSRLQAGDISWTLEQVAVAELVDEAVDAMRVQAEARGIAVTVELPERLDPIRANPEKLQRVLFNLIQNAIRHSPADGTVVVRAERLADMIELEVQDGGAGIPVADRERIFDPFYRGAHDESRTRDEANGGAGLGLAVAQAIVDAHGGRIWLAPADSGTRVRFSVPSAA